MSVKSSLVNWVLVGVMAVTFIVFMKYVAVRFNVPYLSDVMKSV